MHALTQTSNDVILPGFPHLDASQPGSHCRSTHQQAQQQEGDYRPGGDAARLVVALAQLALFEVESDPLARALADMGRKVQERESASRSES